MKQDRKSSARSATKGCARTFLIAGGSLSVGLAVIGIFIPVLPTTPFLLLAAFCFARSSRRCYDWLMHNRWFGPYLRNYREGRGIPLRQKILAITLLWLAIGYAAAFVVPPLWGKILLAAIAAAVTWHLVTVRTYRPDQKAAIPDGPCPPFGSGDHAPAEEGGAPAGPWNSPPEEDSEPPRAERSEGCRR